MKTKFRLMAFICMLAMLATTSFTSCGDDDDDEGSSDPAALVGTWRAVSEEDWDREDDGESSHDKDIFDNPDVEWELITFKEDGTWTSDSWESYKKMFYHSSGTYTVSGNVLKTPQNYSGCSTDAVASFDNGVISFDWTKYTWTDYTDRDDIKGKDYFDDSIEGHHTTFSVNGNTLTITFEETDEGDWYKTVYIFTKQ
jgi:hypothetical protein